MRILGNQLVRFIDDKKIASICVEKLPDVVDPAPDRSVPGRKSQAALNRFYKVAAAHCVITLNISHMGKLRILTECISFSVTASGNNNAQTYVFLAALAQTKNSFCIAAFIKGRGYSPFGFSFR